jgi:hypothetical protein
MADLLILPGSSGGGASAQARCELVGLAEAPRRVRRLQSLRRMELGCVKNLGQVLGVDHAAAVAAVR